MSGHITATHQPLVTAQPQTLVRMLVRDVLIGVGVWLGILAAHVLDGLCVRCIDACPLC